MIFQTHTSKTEIKARICDVKSKALVTLVSLVKKVMMKFEASNSGMRRMTQTIVYHQWRYSFINKKKYQMNIMKVTSNVTTPIATTPHLIGMHRQQVYP